MKLGAFSNSNSKLVFLSVAEILTDVRILNSMYNETVQVTAMKFLTGDEGMHDQ